MMLVIALGGFPLQAADAGAGRPFSSYAVSPLFLIIGGAACLLVLLLAAWRLAVQWRTRILREHDEEIARMVDQWTLRLEQETARRHKAESALQEGGDMAARQERLAAVGQLAAGLAHEFNNILTIIQGHASLLLDTPNMDADSIKSINHVTEGVERITTLVKQMLAFSRKQVMQQSLVDIKESMDESATMLRHLLGAHIVLNFDIAHQLPPIMADREMLQQILANLAVNARDVMNSGGQLTIGAAVVNFSDSDLAGKLDRRTGHYLQFSVTDTGPGIDPSIINHLFEPFFTTKDIGKGTGLGLATVYGMVKQNSGWIEVESTVGIGTTFNIYFAAEAVIPKKPEPAVPPAALLSDGRETILVVEDDTMLRELVREILEANRYQVLDASSGREALHVWEKHKDRVDLLFTDMSMPDGVSGRDLAAILHKDQPSLPVIFSSGFSQERPEGREGCAFLSKPYHPADLAQAVRALLETKGRTHRQPSPGSPKTTAAA